MVNLFESWLQKAEPNPDFNTFSHVSLVESADNRAEVTTALAHRIFVYHNDPEEFREYVEKWGYGETLKQLNSRPQKDRTRKGNFGEILACEYLSSVENFDIPVMRFRWNPNPDESMRGEDALAFKFSESENEPSEICVVEAKVQSTLNKTLTGKAVRVQLGDRKFPRSIKFVSSHLRQQGEVEKATAVMEFLNSLSPFIHTRSDFLMLVTGNQPENPFEVIAEIELADMQLTATHLHLSDLSEFINALFEVEIDVDLI